MNSKGERDWNAIILLGLGIVCILVVFMGTIQLIDISMERARLNRLETLYPDGFPWENTPTAYWRTATFGAEILGTQLAEPTTVGFPMGTPVP